MTDLHTHILPGMDDGAATVEESIQLLEMERAQGVDTVVLTSHFYPNRERPEDFLARRTASAKRLTEAITVFPTDRREQLPALLLGAEVAWRSDMHEWKELHQMCIGSTRNMLVELPFAPWSELMLDRLYEFEVRTGITPVIAHLERYMKIQRREHLEGLLSMGLPVQVGGDTLLQVLGRAPAMKLLKSGRAHLLASDCHNCRNRKPNMGQAMDVVRKKLGEAVARDLIRCADELAGI